MEIFYTQWFLVIKLGDKVDRERKGWTYGFNEGI